MVVHTHTPWPVSFPDQKNEGGKGTLCDLQGGRPVGSAKMSTKFPKIYIISVSTKTSAESPTFSKSLTITLSSLLLYKCGATSPCNRKCFVAIVNSMVKDLKFHIIEPRITNHWIPRTISHPANMITYGSTVKCQLDWIPLFVRVLLLYNHWKLNYTAEYKQLQRSRGLNEATTISLLITEYQLQSAY